MRTPTEPSYGNPNSKFWAIGINPGGLLSEETKKKLFVNRAGKVQKSINAFRNQIGIDLKDTQRFIILIANGMAI